MALDCAKTDDMLLTTIQQEYKILAEYKMIESEKIGGVYVIPSYGNSLLWFGVIFVRQGCYMGGVFRFTITLPDQFPDDKILPVIKFQSNIIHPHICPYTGTLDITNAFPVWKTGEDHIWQVLKYIQISFQDPLECLRSNNRKVNNQEARELLSHNRQEFIARVKESVALNNEHIYDDGKNDDPHYITFEKFDEDVHGAVAERIKRGKDTTGATTSITTGFSWVKEGEFKPLSVE